MEGGMEREPQGPEASQMEIHVLSSCFSCPLNTDIAVMALDPSLGLSDLLEHIRASPGFGLLMWA